LGLFAVGCKVEDSIQPSPGNPEIAQPDCYHSEVISRADRAPVDRVRTIFLDRDGILNEKMPEGQYVTRWEEFHMIAGVPEAVRRLNQGGLRVIVVTNQRGIALGLYSLADVEGIHARFQQELETAGARIDAFFICPHDIDQCNCRKPLPGLFEQAVARFPEISAATSVMIGDSLSDIEFGSNLDMATIFIDMEPERHSLYAEEAAKLADLRCASLADAVDALLSQTRDRALG
jgi:D-glycero-D-manno-heptose 1,7-bisphosphate phosphatase